MPGYNLRFLIFALFALSIFAFFLTANHTEASGGGLSDEKVRGDYRIMFYNVENLFDIHNDPEREDDEFTPGGERRWTWFRFREKLANIYRVIVAAGGWQAPEIVGLCEVENRYVLEELTGTTPLSKAGYEIVHRDSRDRRGIDVALLYRSDRFSLIREKFLEISSPVDTFLKTRDIVYVKGVTVCLDTLHLFVNHWPSRWRGRAFTEPARFLAASVLKSAVDSVFATNAEAKIIIMGDFNDEPADASLRVGLGTETDFADTHPNRLYNLSAPLKLAGKGTIKFRGRWQLFDQFIVSGTLLMAERGLAARKNSASVFDAGFLLVRDEVYYGYKPFRTYEGYRYTGGYSDHLPVYIDLWGK